MFSPEHQTTSKRGGLAGSPFHRSLAPPREHHVCIYLKSARHCACATHDYVGESEEHTARFPPPRAHKPILESAGERRVKTTTHRPRKAACCSATDHPASPKGKDTGKLTPHAHHLAVGVARVRQRGDLLSEASSPTELLLLEPALGSSTKLQDIPNGARRVPRLEIGLADGRRLHPCPDVSGEAPRRHEVRRELPGGCATPSHGRTRAAFTR